MSYDLTATETTLAIAVETSAALDAAAADAGELARARESVVAMDRLVAAIAAGDEERQETIHCCLSARWDAAEAEILLHAAGDRAAKSAAQEARMRRHQDAVLSSLDEAISKAEAEADAAEQRAEEARGRVAVAMETLAYVEALDRPLRKLLADDCRELFRSIAGRLGVSAVAAEEAIEIGVAGRRKQRDAVDTHNATIERLISDAREERAKQVAIRDGSDDGGIPAGDILVPLSRSSWNEIVVAHAGLSVDPPIAPAGLDAGLVTEHEAAAIEQHLLSVADIAERFADEWQAEVDGGPKERATISATGRVHDRLIATCQRSRDDLHALLAGIDRFLAAEGFGGVKRLVVEAVAAAADRSFGPPPGSQPEDVLDHVPPLPGALDLDAAMELIGRIDAIRTESRHLAIIEDVEPVIRAGMDEVKAHIAQQEQP